MSYRIREDIRLPIILLAIVILPRGSLILPYENHRL